MSNQSTLDKLSQIHKSRQPPENAVTIMQYAQFMKISRDQARRFLERVTSEGVIECVGSYGKNREKYYVLKEEGDAKKRGNG